LITSNKPQGTSRIYGGTDQPIVKQLVEPQGGVINVVSKVGKGTTFSFRLNFKNNRRSRTKPKYGTKEKNIKV
jgi:light-regulated signal transduction histidine kinase (bacteriophytochrome)